MYNFFYIPARSFTAIVRAEEKARDLTIAKVSQLINERSIAQPSDDGTENTRHVMAIGVMPVLFASPSSSNVVRTGEIMPRIEFGLFLSLSLSLPAE